MKVVLLTAGAAGMYCGSCMHDNALARALRELEVDCVLQPVYTPIRTDADSIADEQVFFGGIHIYLLQQMPWLEKLPRFMRRALDWPPLIRFATRRAGSTDASKLGQLSVSMLQGSDGKQKEEVERLVDWLKTDMKPDAIVLSNLLIGGAIPMIRSQLPETKIIVILQGDDIFLDHLTAPYRQQVIDLCRGLVPHVDRFLTNSQFYASKMGELFRLPNESHFVSPLSIDLGPFESREDASETKRDFRLGYFARIAPEKGFHVLVDAFVHLASQPEHQNLTLHAGGWLGSHNESYFQEQKQKMSTAGVLDRFTYHGSPDLEGKVNLLRSFDLMSVPTEYHEPKGLFVLESLAVGVPVVQPNHGAFVELIQSTQGGVLVDPLNYESLANAIAELKDDEQKRKLLGEAGKVNVFAKHSIRRAAEDLKRLIEKA